MTTVTHRNRARGIESRKESRVQHPNHSCKLFFQLMLNMKSCLNFRGVLAIMAFQLLTGPGRMTEGHFGLQGGLP